MKVTGFSVTEFSVTEFIVPIFTYYPPGKKKIKAIQSTLGFATMDKAVNLGLATRTAVTDLFPAASGKVK